MNRVKRQINELKHCALQCSASWNMLSTANKEKNIDNPPIGTDRSVERVLLKKEWKEKGNKWEKLGSISETKGHQERRRRNPFDYHHWHGWVLVDSVANWILIIRRRSCKLTASTRGADADSETEREKNTRRHTTRYCARTAPVPVFVSFPPFCKPYFC